MRNRKKHKNQKKIARNKKSNKIKIRNNRARALALRSNSNGIAKATKSLTTKKRKSRSDPQSMLT